MTVATASDRLFELTDPFEELVLKELREYFDWVYLNN